jgi:Domain of unknown function (DUF3291)
MTGPAPTRPVQLAEVNLARLRFPLDSAQAREFVAAVDRIDRLAEQSAGFIWRCHTGEAHPSAAAETGDPLMVINLSVWWSYEHLHACIYRSAYGHYVRRRYDWFDKIPAPATRAVVDPGGGINRRRPKGWPDCGIYAPTDRRRRSSRCGAASIPPVGENPHERRVLVSLGWIQPTADCRHRRARAQRELGRAQRRRSCGLPDPQWPTIVPFHHRRRSANQPSQSPPT